jgi:cytochrome P450
MNWLIILTAIIVAIVAVGYGLNLAWYYILLATIVIPLAILAYVLYRGYQKVKPKPQKNIPVPPYTHPVLGHPDRMLSPLKHELRLEVCEAARAMFHQLVFMSQVSVFINDAEEVVRVLKSIPRKGDIYKVFRLNPDIPDILASDGIDSEVRRSNLGPSLGNKSFPAETIIDNFMKVIVRHHESKEKLDIAKTFAYLAFDAMSVFLFEYDLGALRGSDEGTGLYWSICTLMEAQAKVGIYADPNARTVAPEELHDAKHKWKNYIQKMKTKCIEDADTYMASHNGDLNLDKFSHGLKKMSMDEAYTDAHVASDIHQVFRHGYECIAGTLSWIFYALARNANARSRLIEEVIKSYRMAPMRSENNEFPEYLECVIKETLRRYPVAGIH